MEASLFLVFFCICFSYARDKVFFVDREKLGIHFSDVLPGQLLTELEYGEANIVHDRYPGAMTYDPVTNTMIWGHRDPHKIVTDTLDGVSTPFDIALGVKPICMTFNEFDRRVYWFGNKSRLLNSITLNGTDKIRLAKRKTPIYGLSVDGARGNLYYFELNMILKRPIDGRKETVLFDFTTNVTALTRNAQDDCLYWVTEPGIIDKYDLLTNECSTLHNISYLIGRIDHIVVYNGVFYWTDVALGGIGYIDLLEPDINGFVRNVSVDGQEQDLHGVEDIKVFLDEGGSVDYCSSSPCMKGATCANERFTYVCNNSGVVSTESPEQTNVVCSQCQNGECVNKEGMYECICNEGFTLGNNSQCYDIDECESDQCDQEYGECGNTAGSFYCSCIEGFNLEGDGVTCQMNCEESPCIHGATCIENQCYCPYPFMGIFCQNVNCSMESCWNDGGCFNNTCECEPGFEGALCELVNCEESPCINSATCVENQCYCPYPFMGMFCQNVNCSMEPCQNDGSCLNNTCECEPGFEGALCELESSEQERHRNWKSSRAGILIIFAVVLLVIFIIVVLIFVCYRRKKTSYNTEEIEEAQPMK